MNNQSIRASQAQTPLGIDHLVINVRDIDIAHAFWTDCMGFRQVGTLCHVDTDDRPRTKMRFYSGEKNGQLSHHDIALIESPALGNASETAPQVFNHVAIAYSSLEAWEAQVRFLTQRGVPLGRSIERGATCSVHLHDPDGNGVELVFELPRERWENDIDSALNTARDRTVPA